jgi:murein DD-endopeptidase MepM/ murein hydrolase activator NlpD
LTAGTGREEKAGGTEPTPILGGIAAVQRRKVHRLALIGGASAFAAVAVVAAVSPSPAANSPPAQSLLQPKQAVRASSPLPPTLSRDGEREKADHVRASGRVGPDLTLALQKAGVPDSIGREYVRVLGRAIRLADGLSVEDRFDLVYEPGKAGRLLYVGLDRVARADVELLKWTDGKTMIWVNADVVGGESNQAMRLPVAGRLTSGFGERFHPILGYTRFHAGVDLAAAWGSPIVAAADGRVLSAGWRGGYGRLVAIAHGGGLETIYGHMSRIVAQPGSQVRQGQLIGYVGSSGLSTGPHLHYEVLKNGRAVNPLSVKLASAPAQLQGEKLHAFQSQLRALMLLPGTRG